VKSEKPQDKLKELESAVEEVRSTWRDLELCVEELYPLMVPEKLPGKKDGMDTSR